MTRICLGLIGGLGILLKNDIRRTYPRLMPAEVHILFAVGQKVCKNPTAAPGAMEASFLALPVLAEPANAE